MAESSTPEAQMRRACDLILAGDFFSVMADLTPDAMAEAMAFGGGLSGVTLPTSYDIESHQEMNGDHRYEVVFRTSVGDFRGFAVWRQVDGAWKIASLGVLQTP